VSPVVNFFRRQRLDGAGLRLFFAADIHGNDVCWRKFLNAAHFYEVRALVMGGDLCGKALVPVVANHQGHSAHVGGEIRRANTPEELEQLERAIRMNGFYPWRASPEMVEELRQHEELRAQIFERVIVEDFRRWIGLADAKLASTEVRAYVIPGNDDPWSIDQLLEGSPAVVPCDGRITRIGTHELLSFAWSNRTPWNSYRELDEDDLYRRLRTLSDRLETPQTAIFNVHVPPFDSGLDMAPELDQTLRPVLGGGQPRMIPVGSKAVRQIIEEVQPLLTLHGHIHESQGIKRIGRTVAINPGSEHNSGRLLGCIVALDKTQVRMHQLVAG